MLGAENQNLSEDLKTIETELRDLYRNTPSRVRTVVANSIKQISSDLVDRFYSTMSAQPGAHFFLDHETVNKKLRQALKHWLEETFQREQKDFQAFTRQHIQVGSVHARIKVPEHLVSRGIRELKRKIISNLSVTKLSREDLPLAILFVSTIFDLAFDAMTQAYINRSERNARSDEVFRLFALNQNLAAERERQRAALAEWAHTLLFELQIATDSHSIQAIARSEFGLWVFHRASLLFDRTTEYARLLDVIQDVDASVETLSASPPDARIDRLVHIKTAIGEMNSLVGLLFDRSLEAEGARDPLTQLLNRKFVETIISSEIGTQRLSHHPFSILLIEIRPFNDLRARLGEEGADVIVRRTAQMIFAASRSSDSVFSMGRELFLILQVETELAAARQFADQLADRYASTHFVVDGRTIFDCSLNIAVVEYDGHPDPKELISRAQHVLREQRSVQT